MSANDVRISQLCFIFSRYIYYKYNTIYYFCCFLRNFWLFYFDDLQNYLNKIRNKKSKFSFIKKKDEIFFFCRVQTKSNTNWDKKKLQKHSAQQQKPVLHGSLKSITKWSWNHIHVPFALNMHLRAACHHPHTHTHTNTPRHNKFTWNQIKNHYTPQNQTWTN